MAEIDLLDRQIELLNTYKSISEQEVKQLCHQVSQLPGSH